MKQRKTKYRVENATLSLISHKSNLEIEMHISGNENGVGSI